MNLQYEPVREKTNDLGSDQVRHKPCCTITEGRNLKFFAGFKKRNCTIRVAKTKALISCAVTAQLICGFVFAYADCWFSGATANIKLHGKRATTFALF